VTFIVRDGESVVDEVLVRERSCVVVVILLVNSGHLQLPYHSRCLYRALTEAALPSTARSKSGVVSRLLGSD
jgi:hypothetical protein